MSCSCRDWNQWQDDRVSQTKHQWRIQVTHNQCDTAITATHLLNIFLDVVLLLQKKHQVIEDYDVLQQQDYPAHSDDSLFLWWVMCLLMLILSCCCWSSSVLCPLYSSFYVFHHSSLDVRSPLCSWTDSRLSVSCMKFYRQISYLFSPVNCCQL